jgi:hypothetical protein
LHQTKFQLGIASFGEPYSNGQTRLMSKTLWAGGSLSPIRSGQLRNTQEPSIMSNTLKHQRPGFDEAFREWQKVLNGCGYPQDCEWILDENLVFERNAASASGVKVSYQTAFTLRPADLAQVTYDFFSDFEARMVFYRLGSSHGKSVCLLLCDPIFETRSAAEGFLRRDDWLISFYPGENTELEEITDGQRWKNRLVSGRPLSDVDFCMPLAVLRELEVHGRTLTPYERFGVRMIDAWQRWQRVSGE